LREIIIRNTTITDDELWKNVFYLHR
jgi:hypothetical protein